MTLADLRYNEKRRIKEYLKKETDRDAYYQYIGLDKDSWITLIGGSADIRLFAVGTEFISLNLTEMLEITLY